jgi:signal transduction histidine kinase
MGPPWCGGGRSDVLGTVAHASADGGEQLSATGTPPGVGTVRTGATVTAMTRRRQVSVRARSALAATGAVTIVLVLASLALLVVLHDSVERNALAAATTRAHDVVAELTTDGAITPGVNLDPGPGDVAHIQILEAGQVVEASPAVAGAPPMVAVTGTPGTVTTVAPEVTGPGDGPFVTVVLGVAGVDGADTVVVQQSYEEGYETVQDAAQALLLTVPLLVVVVGAMTYVLVGRALQPVEQIRRRTSQITDADLGTRLDVPPTGDEVAELARTLNGMLERLQAASLAQTQFVADASHELRTPLATVRGELDLALREGQDTDVRRTLGRIAESNDRMQRLVDDLLVLTRTSEPSASRHETDVDLDHVVEQVGFRLRPPAGVAVRVETTPTRVRGHLHELERVVQNLADNAVRHATHQVLLSVVLDGDTAEVRVDDDGLGIPEASRTVVFDRFVRLDEGRARAEGGSGLGLAIVRGIVVSHGGTVEVATSDLGGARLVVRLPALARQEPSATR